MPHVPVNTKHNKVENKMTIWRTKADRPTEVEIRSESCWKNFIFGFLFSDSYIKQICD